MPRVVEGRTGVFFSEQTVESLKESVERFESMSDGFDPQEIRRNAEMFGKERFREELGNHIGKTVSS